VLGLLLAAGPVAGQEAPADVQPSGPIEVQGSGDAAIERRIEDVLGELEGYGGVAVEVSEGVVRLTGEAADGAAVARLDALVGRVEGIVTVENEVAASADVARRSEAAVERFRARGEQLVAFLPLLAVAAGAFAVVTGLGLLVARLRWPWDRLAPNAFVADIYRQVARLVFVVLGAVVALDILGATALLGTILGAAGIVGLALGFAVRDTVENFIASVMLSFRQPFRPNDLVEIEGDLGRVVRLTSRATILLDLDGNQIRIPNATVFKSRVVNYSGNPERRFLFEIGVAPDADLVRVRHVATRTVAELPFTLAEPEPLVWVERIGDGAMVLTATGWIDQRRTAFPIARGEAIRMVKDAIEGMGVEVPDTTYRVQLLGGGTAQVTETEAPPVPGPKPPPAPVDTAPLRTELALERIVAAERGDGEKPDLLDDGAPPE
jgi:small-conductance mechanosensitive channel